MQPPSDPISSTSSSSSSTSPLSSSSSSSSPLEPILSPSSSRYVLFPIRYPEIYRLAKVQTACFWTVEEGNLAKDVEDLKRLTANERHFLLHVLAFFAAADGIVMANIESNFADEVQIAEAR